jgi:hypothetical protein
VVGSLGARWRAIGVFVVIAAGAVVSSPTPAIADSAGPTDYRSAVVGIDPPTPSIQVSIVGGDSFVLLRVDPGVVVEIMGYQNEPYLRFADDGAVFENQRSPATYINGSRYGGGAVPDGADADAEPDWAEVAGPGTGEYAWHDHRAHRMETGDPAGAERGDQILDEVLSIVVDGNAVEVRIESIWMPAPSPWPAVLGVIAGAIVVAVALLAPWRRAWGIVLVGTGGIAAAIGWIGYASLPDSTDPRVVWWLLPVLAVAFGAAALVLGPTPGGHAAAAIAGLELAVWALDRRAGLTKAVLPTDAPYWLDRAVTTGAFTVGVAATAAAVLGLLRPARPHHPRTAHHPHPHPHPIS